MSVNIKINKMEQIVDNNACVLLFMCILLVYERYNKYNYEIWHVVSYEWRIYKN